MPTALQQELKTLAGRCIKLHGTRWDLQEDGTYKEVLTDDAVKTFLTTLCKDADKPDAYINQEAANMMIAALDNSAHDLRQQLAAGREFDFSFIAHYIMVLVLAAPFRSGALLPFNKFSRQGRLQ